jgi:hypothetical protein
MSSTRRCSPPLARGPGPTTSPTIFTWPRSTVVLVAMAAAGRTTNQALDASRVVGGSGIYPFVQNLILGVRNEGLGTALTKVLVSVEEEARLLLGIPDGYPDRGPPGRRLGQRKPCPRLSRRPVQEFTTCDRFDGPPFTLHAAR